MTGRRVVIVGGGFAGAAVAIHLLRRAGEGARVTLVERGAALGRGVAYGTRSPLFLLNVAASKMSLDPEAPGDFVAWTRASATPYAFLPRSLYGSYVEARLAEARAASGVELVVVRGEVSEVDAEGVTLSDGARLAAHDVVLATGIGAHASPLALPADPRVVDGWDEASLATLPRRGDLLVLGAGLTALDVLQLLDARGFDGRVTLVSRHALLPRPHRPRSPSPLTLPDERLASCPDRLTPMLAWGRRWVREAQARGASWQEAIDALRPRLPWLWARLPPADRARFVRRVRPYWDVMRHRAPAEALARVDAAMRRGTVEIVAGQAMTASATGGGLVLGLRTRRGEVAQRRFDAVVVATGPSLVAPEARDALLSRLLASGRATRDPAGLGIVTDPAGRIDGGAPGGPRLWAIGTLRRASSWETTSAPEIARDALALAKELA